MNRNRRQLREAHAHIAAHGRALSMLNLAGCRSAAECVAMLAERASRDREGWVLAYGARVEAWDPPLWPTRRELDKVFGARPCCVMSFDHHAVVANSEAMAAGGLAGGDPAGGVVCRDAAGDPTGLLLESAAYQVWNSAPEPGEAQRKEYVAAALQDLATHGFTEVHDLLSPAWLGSVLQDLEREGRLAARIYMYVPAAEVQAQYEAARRWGSDRVVLAGAKLFADGTLNSGTAWMLEPYAAPVAGMERGKVVTTPEQIRAARERTLSLGLGLAVHAIGDAAVQAVLDVEALVQGEGHGPKTGRGTRESRGALRIEHCEVIDRADVGRFAQLGVVASVQPCHLLADIEVLRRQLPRRLDRVLPLRELIDAGCEPGSGLIFGSDTPIVRPDPEDSIHAAVMRRREGMDEREAIGAGQAITEREAWAAFH